MVEYKRSYSNQIPCYFMIPWFLSQNSFKKYFLCKNATYKYNFAVIFKSSEQLQKKHKHCFFLAVLNEISINLSLILFFLIHIPVMQYQQASARLIIYLDFLFVASVLSNPSNNKLNILQEHWYVIKKLKFNILYYFDKILCDIL